MNRTESRSPVTLPPVTLTPEEAAAVVVALAARPEGVFAAESHAALEKVVTALEPDPHRRAQLLASSTRARIGAELPPAGRHPAGRHPAGRRRRAVPAQPPAAPRLVLLPGGRA